MGRDRNKGIWKGNTEYETRDESNEEMKLEREELPK